MKDTLITTDLKDNYYRTLDFIAIDFETAKIKERMPCQIGITIVKNGIIEDSFSRYIQPPGNEYDTACFAVHGINKDVTAHAPLFPTVWNEIKHYFEGAFIVTHNATFDISVLNKVIQYYELDIPNIKGYACTCDIYDRLKLNEACALYGIQIDNHHDAKCDSMMCAELYLKYVNDIEPNHSIDEVKIEYERDSKFPLFEGHDKICGDLLVKDLSCADPKNPFYDRKVVITGVFNCDRKKLAAKLKSMGADIDVSITRKTHYVVIGNEPGPAKMQKIDKLIHDGYPIRPLYQNDLDNILSGKYEGYYMEKKIRKNLKLSYEHYIRHHITFSDDCYNIIASKELFFGKGFAGDFNVFNQITGNLGAAGDNICIYPETNICVLSNSTIQKLMDGVSDETIKYIENYYNSSKSIEFTYTFLSEQEILDFCKTRCDRCNDSVTMDLYYRYIDSMK